jgi:hypothetical protein
LTPPRPRPRAAAIAFALVGALNTLYIRKPFGTFWDASAR